jgi:murein DD-endopeptidase MepM/ murein hydrolase activator NlpD
MKIIIVDDKHGGTCAIVLKGWVKVVLSVCLVGLPALIGYYGNQLAMSINAELYGDEAVQARLDQQGEEIGKLKAEAVAQLQALTQRVATLQAKLLRLDALGAQLTSMAGLDNGEFDFTQEPPMGGPELPIGTGYQTPDFIQALEDLSRQIEGRQQQLEILEPLIADRKLQDDAFITGRPVSKGWVSSPFGRRIDPFSGKMAWHQGVDFATGRAGAEVHAVAAGVVTFAGDTPGYGLVVKINHGNGYETLYAHDSKILVKPGDVVKRGQAIALSGTTGRSTGPHVHFEVHKNGRVVDPAAYINRNIR